MHDYQSARTVAFFGAFLFGLGLLSALAQWASAAHCSNPATAASCSQSAYSDSVFLGTMSAIAAVIGLSLTVGGIVSAYWVARHPGNRWALPWPPATAVYPCPRCGQALVWSPADARWYCPSCGLFA